MDREEAIQMLRRASDEIKALRGALSVAQPKADAYDGIMTILGMMPSGSRGYAEDLAWRLDKRIEELTAQNSMEENQAA